MQFFKGEEHAREGGAERGGHAGRASAGEETGAYLGVVPQAANTAAYCCPHLNARALTANGKSARQTCQRTNEFGPENTPPGHWHLAAQDKLDMGNAAA